MTRTKQTAAPIKETLPNRTRSFVGSDHFGAPSDKLSDSEQKSEQVLNFLKFLDEVQTETKDPAVGDLKKLLEDHYVENRSSPKKREREQSSTSKSEYESDSSPKMEPSPKRVKSASPTSKSEYESENEEEVEQPPPVRIAVFGGNFETKDTIHLPNAAFDDEEKNKDREITWIHHNNKNADYVVRYLKPEIVDKQLKNEINTFDKVFFLDMKTYHHLLIFRNTVRNLTSLLKTGGHLYIIYPEILTNYFELDEDATALIKGYDYGYYQFAVFQKTGNKNMQKAMVKVNGRNTLEKEIDKHSRYNSMIKYFRNKFDEEEDKRFKLEDLFLVTKSGPQDYVYERETGDDRTNPDFKPNDDEFDDDASDDDDKDELRKSRCMMGKNECLLYNLTKKTKTSVKLVPRDRLRQSKLETAPQTLTKSDFEDARSNAESRSRSRSRSQSKKKSL